MKLAESNFIRFLLKEYNKKKKNVPYNSTSKYRFLRENPFQNIPHEKFKQKLIPVVINYDF